MHISAHMRSTGPVPVAIGATLCALTFSLVIFPLISGPLAAHVDPDRFAELGRNLAAGKGFAYGADGAYVTAFDRAPVYPLLLMILSWIPGSHFVLCVQIMQAIFHGLTGIVLYRIGLEVMDHRTARLAQIVHAVHPIMLWYTARVWVETTNTLLVMAAILMFLRIQKEGSTRQIVMAGFSLALAALTKSVVLLLPFLLMMFAFFRKDMKNVRSLMFVVIVAAVFIAPWTVRNAVQSGRFIAIQTTLGFNLVQGEAIADHWTETPFSTLAMWEKGEADAREVLADESVTSGSPEGDVQLFRHVTASWIRDPVSFIRHVAVNALTYWYLSESPVKSAVILLLQVPLIFFAVRGALHAGEHREPVLILVLAVLYFWGVHAVIVGWMRYSVPVVPALILLAARGVRGSAPHTPAP
jgi:4-amino-4-deoxy-L-arabinose transferase-like glycosyltransferase